MSWETVIGLEVHVQLATRSKLFCGCSTTFGEAPNTNVCEVCLGMPGVLPVMNRQALELTVRMGEALGCTIAERSVFARKNYFYPDLPKGYQISQFDRPICEGGEVPVDLEGETKVVRLIRIHLEEDAGKSIHGAGLGVTHIDLNRAGVPLIEVVSHPDLRSADEASAYLKELRNIVRYLGVSDGHMEQGSFRCDANVSVRRPGEPLGTRAELKNLNSFNHVKRAIEYEAERQIHLLESGGQVTQETRLWDERAQVTRAMRSKEEEHDYRYFPDPDLLPLVVTSALRAQVASSLPELPRARRQRYVEHLDLTPYDADVLTGDQPLSDYFEEVIAAGVDAKTAANWVQGELRGRLNADNREVPDSPVSAPELAEILRRVADGKLSGKLAKQVFAKVYEGADLARVLAETGEQVTDESAIRAEIDCILEQHPAEVSQFLEGKTKVVGFFIGQVMQATRGKANPQVVRAVLTAALEERRT